MVIVSVIGLIFAIVMVILFFNAAPARSNIEVHRGSEEAAECLKCHLRGDEKSPTMPHLNVGQCNLCHVMDYRRSLRFRAPYIAFSSKRERKL